MPARRPCRALLLLAAPLLYAPPLYAQGFDYPFLGAWDCGGTRLVLTDTTYNDGSGDLAIQSITETRNDAILTLQDGREITLAEVSETGMLWPSPASGAQLSCTRAN